MTLARPKIVDTAWLMLPGSLRRRLRTRTGKRFVRFVPVSIAAVVSSQVTLAFLVGVTRVAAGVSAIIASMVGAGVSYVLSRWAWERKGRPDVLRETLPFWAVSVSAWIVLGLASHYASVWAVSAGLGHWQRVLVVNVAYFLANCVTFVSRFVFFHYILFADRGPKGGSAPAAPGGQAGPRGQAASHGQAAPRGGTAAPRGGPAPGDPEALTLAATSIPVPRAGSSEPDQSA
jgi:putative flippase GtrA